MKWSPTGILGAEIIASALAVPAANAANERALFVSVGATTRAPIGWIEFCSEYAPECDTPPVDARDVILTGKAWKNLAHISTSG